MRLAYVSALVFCGVAGALAVAFAHRSRNPPPPYMPQSNCPNAAESVPPTGERADDYVELSRSSCLGTCPDYRLRVTADGAVSWVGTRFVKAMGVDHAKIPAANARKLLEAFRTPAFWGACADYTYPMTDNASYALEVQMGGRKKRVDEYAHSAPDFIHDLEALVDAAADSHRWRVGDPKTESIEEIRNDAWLPKPGKTRLMFAAADGKAEEIEAALAAGDKVTDVDASGWTPLMYAAGRYGGNVKLLLQKGAAVNARGLNGETALMFAALSRGADGDLLGAHADVNAATKDGVTTLMVLAQRADAEGVAGLLAAGAKADAKDAQGRNAVDYLEAANCGDWLIKTRSYGNRSSATCDVLFKDSFEKTHQALEHAGATHTRVWAPGPSMRK